MSSSLSQMGETGETGDTGEAELRTQHNSLLQPETTQLQRLGIHPLLPWAKLLMDSSAEARRLGENSNLGLQTTLQRCFLLRKLLMHHTHLQELDGVPIVGNGQQSIFILKYRYCTQYTTIPNNSQMTGCIYMPYTGPAGLLEFHIAVNNCH